MISSFAFCLRIKYFSNWLITFALFLGLAFYGFWKFEEVLTIPERCITNSGDGIGTIAGIFNLWQDVDEEGLSVLFMDVRSEKRIGFGLAPPSPMSMFWRWNYYLLSFLFSPQDIYDFNVLIGHLLIGIFGFLLLREMSVSPLFSLVGSFMLMNTDNFYSRIGGHLSLSVYFGPILLILTAVRAGKRPSLFRLILFASANALNFQINEYYGYFGLYFSWGLFLGYFIKYHCFSKSYEIDGLNWKYVTNIILSVFLFISLMFMLYPTIVFQKSLALLFPNYDVISNLSNSAQTWNDFLLYSVRSPLAIFQTSLPLLKSLSGELFLNNPGEFTFRIGMIPALFPLLILLFFSIRVIYYRSTVVSHNILDGWLWVFPALLMVLFSLDAREFVSLSPLTFKISPMFRVGARAFFYVSLTLIILFIYTNDKLFRLMVSNFLLLTHVILRRSAYLTALLILILIFSLGLFDAVKGRAFERIPSRQLPDVSVYEVFKHKEIGLVLELPIYSPYHHAPECNYKYFYFRTKHGFPLFNWQVPVPETYRHRDKLQKISEMLNSASPEILEMLRVLGIKYVIVNKKYLDNFEAQKSKYLRLIADAKGKAVYEVVGTTTHNSSSNGFLEYMRYHQFPYNLNSNP